MKRKKISIIPVERTHTSTLIVIMMGNSTVLRNFESNFYAISIDFWSATIISHFKGREKKEIKKTNRFSSFGLSNGIFFHDFVLINLLGFHYASIKTLIILMIFSNRNKVEFHRINTIV